MGASGKLGQQLISEAIDDGYDVNALVRDPAKLRRGNELLQVFRGDARTGEGVDAVVKGCPYVVSALGASTPVMAECMSKVIPLLKGKWLKRFVFISWMGVGDSQAQELMDRGLITSIKRVAHKKMFEDIGRAEGLIRESGLPYVILRPTLMTDGPLTGQVEGVSASDKPPGAISRADVARYVVDLLDQPGWEKRELTLGRAAKR